ncbi:MAG: phosphoenolpyruvate carboxykinase (ATP) [Planctomycetales bacterium]|nr:phosphoenolpyruvate carboxykinase (ATP) [Planctomycetales bacterium]
MEFTTVTTSLDLSRCGITVQEIIRNASTARLYEYAIIDRDAVIANTGALATRSGDKTGRCPKDKRIVESTDTAKDIWWGDINIRLTEKSFLINRQRARDYLNTRPKLFVTDGYAGWDPRYRLKIRVICASAYHALFMRNMLIVPSDQELAEFDDTDYTIYNAGHFPANPYTAQMTSTTSVDLSFELREFVILGTQYAGEMKKGVFTIMNYLMPRQGVLSMHCSANQGDPSHPSHGGGGGSGAEDVTLFFGLSGTGKTTLSADPQRLLIGDDEHCWSDEGIFNIEGGCYAKVIHLTAKNEPEIFDAIRFGAVLENVVYDPGTHDVNYDDASITENTRVAYPIDFIPRAKIPCVGGHPKNIVFLTCDAFGVLPPVSKLTSDQAMYHFISGYTAKIAGTEMGVREPTATFSTCFGAAFMVWHPSKYAELLKEKIDQHQAAVWLVNTGWTGGSYGTGKRMSLTHTRAIIDAIHSGALVQSEMAVDPNFGLQVPTTCPRVDRSILQPAEAWQAKSEYQAAATKLARLFHKNFEQFAAQSSPAIGAAGPVIE